MAQLFVDDEELALDDAEDDVPEDDDPLLAAPFDPAPLAPAELPAPLESELEDPEDPDEPFEADVVELDADRLSVR